MIVVDTSVVISALLGHDPARRAISSRRLLAPHVIDAEVAHAVRGLALGGKLRSDDAERVLRSWSLLSVDRLAMAGLLQRVWELRDNVTAYDALFVAAAEAHDITLVTADRRLAGAAGVGCSIELISTTG